MSQSSPGHRDTTDGCTINKINTINTINTAPGPCCSHRRAAWPPGDEVVSLHGGQIVHGDNAVFVGNWVTHGIFSFLWAWQGWCPRGRLAGASVSNQHLRCANVWNLHVLCYLLSSGDSGWSLEMCFVFPPHFPAAWPHALAVGSAALSVPDVGPWSVWRHWTCCHHRAPPSPPRAVCKEPLDSCGCLPGFCLQEQLVGLMLRCDFLKGSFTARMM